MEATIRVLGIAGSLREHSFNRSAIRAAQQLAPEGVDVEIFDIADIPLYNADVEAKGFPESVEAMRAAISQADALLFATPEYNRGISGVLKNAIDWASRKGGKSKSPLFDKPVAIMGASDGGFGTSRAQKEFFALAVALGMHVYQGGAQVYISNAGEKFSPAGELTDDQTKQSITELLEGLRDWTRRLA